MTEDPTTLLLTDLGLSGYEAAAYLTLLRREVFTPGELSLVATIPRQRIHDVVESLKEKGLCQFPSAGPRTVSAVEPGLALAALRARKERELTEERTRLAEKAGELERRLKLLDERGPGPQGPLRYLETYTSPVQIASIAGTLAAGASAEIRALLTGPAVFAPEVSTRLFEEPLKRGVNVRVLCDHSVKLSGELGGLMWEFFHNGLEVRLLEGESLPVRLEIVEQAGVLLYLRDPLGGAPRYRATVIYHAAMVAAMHLLFETLWQRPRARRLDAYGHPAT